MLGGALAVLALGDVAQAFGGRKRGFQSYTYSGAGGYWGNCGVGVSGGGVPIPFNAPPVRNGLLGEGVRTGGGGPIPFLTPAGNVGMGGGGIGGSGMPSMIAPIN